MMRTKVPMPMYIFLSLDDDVTSKHIAYQPICAIDHITRNNKAIAFFAPPFSNSAALLRPGAKTQQFTFWKCAFRQKS